MMENKTEARLQRINACFRSNDIRCVYGSDVNEELMYHVARAFVTKFKCKQIFVGRDTRASSKSLSKNFIKGARDQGADVIDLGLVDTPAIYFASGYFKKPGAIITASHNPLEHNGVKLVKSGAEPVGSETGLNNVKALIIQNKFKTPKKRGKLIKKNIFKEYKKYLFSIIKKDSLKPLRIVVDAGHGTAAEVVPKIYKGLPIKIIPLDFTHKKGEVRHRANPAEFRNLADLQQVVRKKKADFGMAFDTDMDRVFFVDEKGGILSSSITAAIIIKNLMGTKKGKKIIYSLICSKIVPETIKQYHGKPLRGRVGHAYIKEQMKKNKAKFAVERSGHYYYSNNFHADSAIITSLIMCEIYSRNNQLLSDLAREFKKYSKIEEQNIEVKDPKEIIMKVESVYKRKAKKHDHFDGLTMEFKDFWFNIRASQTESLLRINLEATNHKIREREYKKLRALIKKHRHL